MKMLVAGNGALRARKSLGLFLSALIGCVPAASAMAKPAAAAKMSLTRFSVGARALTGTPKLVCVIEGRWADGEPLRFESWDACPLMHVRPATLEELRGHGTRGQSTAGFSDIPEGAEVLEFSNEYSSVLVFRDAKGRTREILIRD